MEKIFYCLRFTFFLMFCIVATGCGSGPSESAINKLVDAIVAEREKEDETEVEDIIKTGSIVGIVIDSQTGIGVSGVTVNTSPSTGSVITDINGAFSINDVNVGEYTVAAHASDYNSNSVTCNVDSSLTTTTNIVLVSSGGSFSRNILPIFSVNCAISGCHNDDTAAGQLRLNNYAAVMAGSKSGAVIYPGDSSGSKLMKQIKGIVTPKMPLNSASLSISDQGKIANWIAGRALNN